MDPNLFIDSRVAPASIKYSQMVPLSFKAKQKSVLYTTSNQSTYTQQNNLIRIPMASSVAFQDGPNTFLKFLYTNNSGAPQRFSNSAHSLIKHMRVISSQGVDLENIR